MLYQLLWYVVRPCLKLNARMRIGYKQRTLKIPPSPADLWIQAASVGEAYLAWELVKKLPCSVPTTILITSNTSQGFDILLDIAKDDLGAHKTIKTAYFPFDQPSIMTRALAAVEPKALVLLESELWPGLMAACKRHEVKTLVINGRMTKRSMESYLRWPTIWRDLRPDKILAMSEDDAQRFSTLYGSNVVDTMTNIKFDRLTPGPLTDFARDNPLSTLFTKGDLFIVLGSIRREEEDEIATLLADLYDHNDQLIIGLFPRHMHRINNWKNVLTSLKLPWELRSTCAKKVEPGTIILWDTMGELEKAYRLARSAFVGGSLAPVGGQNFLEPISCGIRPVIGPHWTNFAWVGREIIDQGLVCEVQNRQDVAEYLLEHATKEPDRQSTKEALQTFIRNRQGGTMVACQHINSILGKSDKLYNLP